MADLIGEIILMALFVLGAGGIAAMIAYGMVGRLRDKRTRDERLADEHGDMARGTFRITPGIGGNVDGGTTAL